MSDFDKELAQYGILAKNGKQDIKDNKITIIDAEIKEIKFQKLQEAGIKEIRISGSEIKYLYFLVKNTIKIDFRNCNFKNQIIARELYFKNEVKFQQCIFDAVVDFSKTKFDSRVDFLASVFKEEVRFIGAQFSAEQSNNETIENDFGEVIFEGRTSFFNATFKARVSFRNSQFKEEARFIKTQFQAGQSNNETIEIENVFREVIFKGKVVFDSLVFKARISFSFSIFKDETLFLNINPNNCIFRNVEFNKINFLHIDDINVVSNAESYVFQNTVFKDALSFKGMEFERLEFDNVLFNGVVTFSNTKFNAKPQFINCAFSNQFNIEHQYIKYSDKDIENKINNIQDKNDKFRVLLNLRDLFRKLKSNRIAHHNLIDASELRTQELYARELELKYQENKNLREKIEQWQLFFYRKLCDHHTDLLLNLRWLVVLIGSLALLYFTSRVIQDINLLKVLNQYGVCLSIVGVFNLLCLYWFGYIKKFDFFVYFNLIAVLWVMCYKPKIIFGIVNLIDSNSYNGFENALITIYTILLALVLFSLQKTARKNSIVPS
ncbi:TPA: pentapeptide repeat-containing protein [Campylobacter coli]|nr:pentapeptide repeat-containing protein [Campylobacter coli]